MASRPDAADRRFNLGLGFLPIVVLYLASAARAQEPRAIRANDLYKIRSASELAFSPDGRQIAFVVTQIDSAADAYFSHIWLADVRAGNVHQHTRGSVRDRNAAWSPDGRRIAFVSDREGTNPQIYVVPVDGGEAQQVTHLENGASNPVWSPDGRTLLFTSTLTTAELQAETGKRTTAESAARTGTEETADEEASAAADSNRTPITASDTAMFGPIEAIRKWLAANASRNEPAVITRLDFQGERSLAAIEAWSHIYAIDLEVREPRRLTDGPYDHQAPAYSPDGTQIALTATISPELHPDYAAKIDLYVMNSDGSSMRELPIPGYSVSEPRWSPDGTRIAFLARDTLEASASNRLLGVINTTADAPTVSWPSRQLDRSVRRFRWSADGVSLYFSAAVHGTVPLYRANSEDGQVRQIISGERGVQDFDVSEDVLTYAITEPSNPSEVYTAKPGGDDERRLTRLNAGWLTEVRTRPHEGFFYESYDGRRIQAWLIAPLGYPADGETKFPLVLEIHGGPHAMWGPGESTMWHEFQLLAANGYGVLYTNPRGSDGYGLEFKNAIRRAWGDGPMRDVLTAVDTVVQRGVVDRERMVVTGGSYAGYLTAYLIGHDHRFKAAVAQRGVYDLSTFFGEGNAWRLIPREFDTYPWEDLELLRRESPITYAPAMQTPLLIMHSDRDLRTGVSQSEMLYRTLKVLRKPVEYVRYPREGHDLSRSGDPRLRIDRLLRILEFFDRHVGAPPN